VKAIQSYLPSRDERERFRDALIHGVPALLVGPTGVGKTTLIEEEVARLGRSLITLGGHVDLDAGDLVGRLRFGPNGSEWHDGPLTFALRSGAVFYLDEISSVPDEVLKVAFSVLDHRRQLHLAHREIVDAAPGFAFVGAYNPGQRGTMSGLSPATRQRFRFIEIDYLRPDEEQTLIVTRTGVSPKRAEQLVECARVTRGRLDGRIAEGASTRLLLAAADELSRGFEFQTVRDETLVCALTDDPRTKKSLRETLGMITEFDALPEPPPAEEHVPPEDVYDGFEEAS